MKEYWLMVLINALCYFGTAFLFVLPNQLLWIKYVSFATMLFYIARLLLIKTHFRIKRAYQWLHLLAYLVLVTYFIFSLDTFAFHSWLPIPGLLRYAAFDFYLCFIPVFLAMGAIAGIQGIEADENDDV